MKHKKIASLLAIAVLSLATPFFSIPRVHAFSDTVTWSLTGVQNYSDPLLGSVVSAREGSIVTFTVVIESSSTIGPRNFTVGARFDWMPSYVNASGANPGDTLEVSADQDVTVTLSITLPPLSGTTAGYNLYTHDYFVRVWSGPLNSPTDCSGTALRGCFSASSGNFAIYSNVQADGLAAREQANERISYLSPALGFGFVLVPGQAKAASDLAQAQAERDLGNTNYAARDFGAARTNYQNALNLANSAAAALAGGDGATYTNVLFNGIGWLLIGVGVFIAGFGGFWYLLRRPKTKMA